MVSCKYAGIGFNNKLPHKDVQQHENDASHLHLAIETVNEQWKEIAVRDELGGTKYTLTLKQQDGNIMAGPCVLISPST